MPKTKTPEYRAWTRMITAANKTRQLPLEERRDSAEIQSSWWEFENFLKDMGKRPEGFEFYRKEKELPWSANNCKWISTAERRRKPISTSHLIEYEGEIRTVAYWCSKLSVPSYTVYGRLERGWTPTEALTTDFIRHKRRTPSSRWDFLEVLD